MKIELEKKIKLYTIEFIGEVDFFEVSPYIELLKGLHYEDELIEKLKEKKLPQSAIKNVLKNLQSLGVVNNGYIGDVETGFPEKEYGKYSLEFYDNSEKNPFKNKNRDISRINVDSNIPNEKIKHDPQFFKSISGVSKSFKNGKSFEIKLIENDNILLQKKEDKIFELVFSKNQWNYKLEDKTFSMDSIDLEEIFGEDWDGESFKVEYSQLLDEEKKDEILNKFLYSFTAKNIDIDEYGEFTGEFTQIPVIPKTEKDARQWFLCLLKKEIEKKNSYISKDELEQIWLNLLDDKGKLKKFNLEFDFELIMKEFGKESKFYWLLQAGIDLYPFSRQIHPQDRIVFKNEKAIDLKVDFTDKFNIGRVDKLIIVDRYINTKRHVQILEDIFDAFGKPKIKIFTTAPYREREAEQINLTIKKNGFSRVIKDKKDIPHDRHWIFNGDIVYKTGKSVDFLKVNPYGILDIEHTSFDLYDKKDVDKEVLQLIGLIDE